uniref:Nif3-like dinuclear metal center hexameric protein n=1 Tax=Gemmiger formicilis TaxID=745368 RepID=UPI00402760B4
MPGPQRQIRYPQTGNLRKPAVKQNPSGGKNMSVSVQQILGFLRAVAPQELALDWDNVGLLVDAGQPVDGVLTTLDITPAVVREAVEN